MQSQRLNCLLGVIVTFLFIYSLRFFMDEPVSLLRFVSVKSLREFIKRIFKIKTPQVKTLFKFIKEENCPNNGKKHQKLWPVDKSLILYIYHDKRVWRQRKNNIIRHDIQQTTKDNVKVLTGAICRVKWCNTRKMTCQWSQLKMLVVV